jgi:hypothetical protein
MFRSRAALSAEVLFLQTGLAIWPERQVQPRRLNDSARFSLILWSHLCNRRDALVIVKPDTLIGWHRKGFQGADEILPFAHKCNLQFEAPHRSIPLRTPPAKPSLSSQIHSIPGSGPGNFICPVSVGCRRPSIGYGTLRRTGTGFWRRPGARASPGRGWRGGS